MGIMNCSKGPIQLYALPGTEDYVKRVTKWLGKDFYRDIAEGGFSISEYFSIEEKGKKAMKNHNGSEENFLAKLLKGDLSYFSHRNGAIEISIKDSVRLKDIYLFHTFSEVDIIDNNKKLRRLSLGDQEVLLYNTLDAFLEAKVNKITIFEMNLGQSRSDRPKGRGACNLRTFFRNITANGASHFFIYHIHSNKSLIGLDNTRITYDNLRGQSILKKHILHKYVKTLEYFKNVVQKEWLISSVDAGGKEFATRFAKSFMTPLLVVDKRRNAVTNVIEEIVILKPESLSVKDKVVFIVDDMIDSGGSIAGVCRKYKELGAKEINIVAFYGLFSPPAEETLNKLREEGALNKLIVTDLITHDVDFFKRNPYIEVVNTSYTTARIIMKTNFGESLEKYFLPLNAQEYLRKKVEPYTLQKNKAKKE